uniref:Uncharacterized protein n=1 Tax=Bombyx mori TaxID=7091 RepID=A0A8R2QTU4_BOMMO|nr:serine/threonine-protein phosphatase 6 regulatory ankyrin repeat subunit C [Bombyx mori]XP_037868790.1 serine/threonine-protein phosphatase 6 regulatory ankyrin repeat subunit C [Bombyx mori]XP_037868791.1 serine/threonine-protein phosphatase 6 regulatory ankyrin repeat subunit C [Bombyx mori]XP_037868792.1 serine/threonine-protein phosphatase 6 regulatory ankyrin repeat subunit C [Bombyx mori]XP_037868793.1 serine/threonine-protein phosphatase 6 regulatory ankyrin repeat subunit C [Bombyx m
MSGGRYSSPFWCDSGLGGVRAWGAGAGAELGRRLLVAARGGDTTTVLELMAKGAPFTTDWLGTSPLHLAASNNHVETCAVLLRAGVSRDSRTKVDRTPLHLAAYAGHADVIALLLRYGAQVDCRDMLRMTPLHWAVQRGHGGAAAELVRGGADPTALSKFHKSPLSLAAAASRADSRADILALIEDALKQREAAHSVDALVTEQSMSVDQDAQPQINFDPVQNIPGRSDSGRGEERAPQEQPIKIEIDNRDNVENSTENRRSVAAAILRAHGIAPLPPDRGSTLLTALQSGRTLVLSDAGKLMLKESTEPQNQPFGGSKPANSSSGVLLTATPVKSPPAPGVKIFTFNKMVNNKIPIKKIINPHDMQVKFVQLPPNAKIISPSKVIPVKNKPKVSSEAGRPAVKIIMNKNNFKKLIANVKNNNNTVQNKSDVTNIAETGSSELETGTGGSVWRHAAEGARRAELAACSTQPAVLRAALHAAATLLRDLTDTLRHCERHHT